MLNGILVTCPRCQKTVRVKAALAGRAFHCPNKTCNEQLTVPSPGSEKEQASFPSTQAHWSWMITAATTALAACAILVIVLAYRSQLARARGEVVDAKAAAEAATLEKQDQMARDLEQEKNARTELHAWKTRQAETGKQLAETDKQLAETKTRLSDMEITMKEKDSALTQLQERQTKLEKQLDVATKFARITDPIEKEMMKLEGTWQFTGGTKEDEGVRMVIKDNKFTLVDRDKKVLFSGTFTVIEVKGTARKTDIVAKDQGDSELKIPDIAEWIDEDTFRMCGGLSGKRPTEFADVAGQFLHTWKRVKE